MRIVVVVYDPYRTRHRHLLVYIDALNFDTAVLAPDGLVAVIVLRTVSGVEGYYREGLPVPVLRIRPVYLHVRLLQHTQAGFGTSRPGRHGGRIGLEIVGKQVAQRPVIARGSLAPEHAVSHPGTGAAHQVGEHILLVITVLRRGADGIEHLPEVRAVHWKRRQDSGELLQREAGSGRLRLHDIGAAARRREKREGGDRHKSTKSSHSNKSFGPGQSK